ncbi:MAG: DUF255 domain-containing protein [Deltaproteobacteria bacterium]|nr:MAG: DUF255 domain-containing protein [Deltaproteobacteria bacterium]
MRPFGSVVAALAALAAPAAAHAAGTGGDVPDILADGMVWAFLAAFGWGFLTSLTPCVYPMAPIIVAVFGARDEAVTRRRAMLLATAFVLGICTLYTVLGVAFALAGKQSNELLANPWVIVPIAGVLVALAASMFGAFELRLPHGLQQRLNRVGGKGVGGSFALGLVLGVVAAPCTGAFAAGIILMIAKGQNVPLGAAIMFTYALGMGLLFWVLAVFAVSLPKSGPWMEAVKSLGGVVLLVMAGYFLIPIAPALTRIIQPSAGFAAGAVAVALAGAAVGAIHLSFHGSARHKLRKAAGVALMTGGLFALVAWYLAPKRALAWRHDEQVAFAEARAAGKHVLIDVGAEWCVPCRKVEKIFGSDELYDDITSAFVPLKIDVTDPTERNEALRAKWGAHTLPTVIFADADGRELGRYADKDPSVDGFRRVLAEVVAAHPPGS